MDPRYLIEACEYANGDLTRLKRLVSEGADVNAVNSYGESCLGIACNRGHSEMVSYLVRSGADVNQRTNGFFYHDKTPLGVCINLRQFNCLKMLAANGPRVDEMGNFPKSIAELEEPYIELLLGLPWCSFAQKIATLELHGANCVDKGNIGEAYRYWSLALEERLLAEPCDRVQCKAEKVHPVYGQSREFLTYIDLDRIKSSEEDMQMQALIIRERILGPHHSQTYHFVLARADIFCKAGRYDKCISLCLHVIDMQVRGAPYNVFHPWDKPMTALMGVFTLMLSIGAVIRSQDVLPAFSNAVQMLSFAMEHSRSAVDICQYYMNDYDDHYDNIDLYLKHIIHCIGILVKLELRGEDEHSFLRILREFVELNSRQPHLASPLHIACKFQDYWFPTYDVARLLLEAGANPRVTDIKGETLLQSLAKTSALTGRNNQRLITLLLSLEAPSDQVQNQINSQGRKSLIQYLKAVRNTCSKFLARFRQPSPYVSFGHVILNPHTKQRQETWTP